MNTIDMRRKTLLGLISLSIFLVFAVCSPALSAAEKKNLAGLAFMHGNWSCSDSGTDVEEYWSAAKADSMTGYCRFISDGKTTTYELLSIVYKSGLDKSGELILRIRHFDGELKPWPDEKESGDLKLIELAKNRAVFDNQNTDKRVKITYQRSSDRVLTAQVLILENGKEQSFSFDYQLKP